MPTRDPVERLIRNLLLVQRVGSSITAEVQPLLDELFNQIADDLRRIDPGAPNLERWRQYRAEQFVDQVRERTSEKFPEIERAMRSGLAQVGRSQGKFAEQILVASLGEAGGRVTPTPITQQRVRAILNSKPFQGELLRDWASGLEEVTVRRIGREVKLGMAQEETLDDLVRRVRGRQAGFVRRDPRTGAFVEKGTRGAVVTRRFTGGVWETTTRDAEGLVRSAVSFVNGESHLETYRANDRLIKELEFVATLDERVSEVCAALDSLRYALDDPAIPVPGVSTHYGGCRSDLVPVIDYEGVGLPEPPEGERAARNLHSVPEEDLKRKVSARRSSGDLGPQTRVRSSTRYEQYLRDAPERAQNRALGVGKARLFREGKLSLRDLIRDDRTVIPLRELLGDD